MPVLPPSVPSVSSPLARRASVPSMLVTATLLFAAPLAAQNSRATGFVVGGHVGGSSMVVEDSDRSNGAGGGGMLGWGFSNGLGVFGQFDQSNIDVRNQDDVAGRWSIRHVDVGLRYHFLRPTKSVVPFLSGAYTFRDVGVTELETTFPGVDKLDLTGSAFTLGGGVMLYPMAPFAFQVAALFTWGKLGDAEVNGEPASGFPEPSTQSSRLTLGVVFWP